MMCRARKYKDLVQNVPKSARKWRNEEIACLVEQSCHITQNGDVTGLFIVRERDRKERGGGGGGGF